MPRSCLMIHPRTTRCVIDSTLVHDMIRLTANEILSIKTCNHLVSHSKLPTYLITVNPQIQIVSSCVDCKLARVISKPQPWRRTESSDRNVLLQVVTATTHSAPFLLLLPIAKSQLSLSHTVQFTPHQQLFSELSIPFFSRPAALLAALTFSPSTPTRFPRAYFCHLTCGGKWLLRCYHAKIWLCHL